MIRYTATATCNNATMAGLDISHVDLEDGSIVLDYLDGDPDVYCEGGWLPDPPAGYEWYHEPVGSTDRRESAAGRWYLRVVGWTPDENGDEVFPAVQVVLPHDGATEWADCACGYHWEGGSDTAEGDGTTCPHCGRTMGLLPRGTRPK